MRVRLSTDAAAFHAAARELLHTDPVLNTMMLTRLEYLSRTPAAPVTCIAVRDDDRVIGAALATPGHGVFLGALPDDQVPVVAEAVARVWPDLSAVEGTTSAARLFASYKEDFRQTGTTRLLRLDGLRMPEVPGAARRTGQEDLDLCIEWMGRFQQDVGYAEAGLAEATARAIEERRSWLWIDEDRPVSLLGHQPSTCGVVRIGPVYTPHEHRRRGYASALTAKISEMIQQNGDEACLYTDLGNPTSNRIYAAIGFGPVADFARYSNR